MTRQHCLDCQDGRHCRHRGYVPAGMILARLPLPGLPPEPIQARLFSHALVENSLGPWADCDQPAHQAPGRRRRPARHQPLRGLQVPPLTGRDLRPRPGQL
jgi:hypothetical protein